MTLLLFGEGSDVTILVSVHLKGLVLLCTYSDYLDLCLRLYRTLV